MPPATAGRDQVAAAARHFEQAKPRPSARRRHLGHDRERHRPEDRRRRAVQHPQPDELIGRVDEAIEEGKPCEQDQCGEEQDPPAVAI